IPQLHRAAAVLTFRNRALEVAVVERMVLHCNGKALVLRIQRRALRHGPRLERSIQLETEIEVQAPRCMLLNHETQTFRTLDWQRTDRLDRLGEVPHRAILRKLFRCHTLLLDMAGLVERVGCLGRSSGARGLRTSQRGARPKPRPNRLSRRLSDVVMRDSCAVHRATRDSGQARCYSGATEH